MNNDMIVALVLPMGTVYCLIGFFVGADYSDDGGKFTVSFTRGIFWFPIFVRGILREAWRILREE